MPCGREFFPDTLRGDIGLAGGLARGAVLAKSEFMADDFEPVAILQLNRLADALPVQENAIAAAEVHEPVERATMRVNQGVPSGNTDIVENNLVFRRAPDGAASENWKLPAPIAFEPRFHAGEDKALDNICKSGYR